MKPIPCPLCGYDAPGLACPHCGLSSTEPTLAAPAGRRGSGLLDGLRALPIGLAILARTPRIKRLLVPPVVLTASVFALAAWWCWTRIDRLLEAARQQSVAELGLKEGWWRDTLEWLLERGVVIALAKTSGLIVFAVVTSFVALWTFSIAYEAIAGPFLDEAQGRIETRWFGRDPYKTVERPNDISERRIAQSFLLAAAPSLVAILLWAIGDAPGSRWWLVVPPLALLVVALFVRDFGVWLAWALGAQMRTLFVSLKASTIAGVVLVLFFWLKFVPFLGYPLFAMVAGFSTALSLLDIPFSRRRFDLRQRIAFLLGNVTAIVAFGTMTSLLFIVPIVGPLIGVPAASFGGLWLLCRLDKNALRPLPLRIPRTAKVAEVSAPS